MLIGLLDKAVAAAKKSAVELRYNMNATIAPEEGWITTIMGTPYGPVRLMMRKKPEDGTD